MAAPPQTPLVPSYTDRLCCRIGESTNVPLLSGGGRNEVREEPLCQTSHMYSRVRFVLNLCASQVYLTICARSKDWRKRHTEQRWNLPC